MMWSFQAPGEAWALNITPDGRLAAGAFGDGSIRWYRMSDGAELLALFAHRDGARWVAWTPAGHYLASPGADSLIGWHVNHDPDKAADFFSVGRFRDVYYQPDIVRRALGAVAEAAPADIGQLLPPVVASLALAGGAEISVPRISLRPDLYLLAAGVSRYATEELRLNFAHKDARDFAAMLDRQDGRAYGEVHLRVLADSDASAAALRDGLAWLRRE
ncbi:MAG: WD40 repeat domain-containing protein, partial [Alphaproteobacteria bacterium]